MADVYGYRISRHGKTELTVEEFDRLCDKYPNASVWCEASVWYIAVN